MAVFNRIVGGLRGLVRRDQAERELDAELQAYLEAAADEKVAKGLSHEAALRAARLDVGNLEAAKDRVRDVGWESIVDGVWQDVRFAFRLLRRQPGFTAAAVVTL